MSAIRLWFVVEWRQRWRALLGLLLLVAFATAAIGASVAGARRGSTAVDRLLDRTRPATLAVLLNQGPFDWDRVRAMPEVAAVAAFAVSGFEIDGADGRTEGVESGFPFIDDEIWDSIERPVVLDGRVPDPGRADEVAVTRGFVTHTGLGVGDELTLRLYTAEQLDSFDEGEPAGPEVPATIVGVIRSGWFADRVDTTVGAVFASPGLAEQYPDNLVGTTGTVNVNALVRLAPDVSPGEFERAFASLTGVDNTEYFDLVEAADQYRDLTAFEARALVLLALAALTAGTVLIGVAVSRYVASSFAGLDVVRSFGLDRSRTQIAAAAAPVSAATAGAIAGTAVSWWASRWFPVGSAALVEPSPGADVDPMIWLVGAFVAPCLVAAVAAVTVGRRWSASRAAAPATRSRVESATAAWPLSLALGTRYALSGRSARNPVPARAALLAATLAVAGVVAGITFAAGIADATADYERFGQTYGASSFLGAAGNDFVDPAATVSSLVDDIGVTGVIDARNDVATASAEPVSLFTYAPEGDDVELVVVAGRLPGPDEIALAPTTMAATGVDIGDELLLAGTTGSVTVTVSGTAFVPAGPHNDYASGGWIRPESFDAMFDGYRFRFGLVWTAPGVDPQAVAARTGVPLESGPLIPPTERAELAQLRTVPLLLSAFLAILGAGAVAHTLASTARRRRHDVAMLRALGMRPRQTAAIVFVQAAVMALVGTLIGVPAGLAIGRAAWRSIALDTPIEFVVPDVRQALAVVVALVVLLAVTFAVWPSRRLSRMNLGSELRYE